MARAEYWLPYITELGADADTILIGHSSGAVASMRYAETNTILGSVLVGGNHTDLGLENEAVSHYYDHPWNWDAIKKNQTWIIEFASIDDPFIPIEESRFIAEQLKLGPDYHEFTDRGHFGHPDPVLEFPELVEALRQKI